MSTRHTFVFLCNAVIISLHFFFSAPVFAWDDSRTHRDLAEKAAYKSLLGTTQFLSDQGMTGGLLQVLSLENRAREIYKWLQEGARLEDKSIRSYNHFHNPLILQ